MAPWGALYLGWLIIINIMREVRDPRFPEEFPEEFPLVIPSLKLPDGQNESSFFSYGKAQRHMSLKALKKPYVTNNNSRVCKK